MGCFENEEPTPVSSSKGLLIVTVIALLVLLAFEAGKGGPQLLNREPEGGVYVGAVNKPADKATVLKAIKPYLRGANAATSGAAVTL